MHCIPNNTSIQIHSIAQAGREKRNSGDLVVSDDAKADQRFIFNYNFYTSTVTKTSTSYTRIYVMTIGVCTPADGLFYVGLCG